MGSTTLKLFLTGDPGCGKTSVIREVVRRLEGSLNIRGFVTESEPRGGQRQRFVGKTLDGQTFVLARRERGGTFQVGPYGVELGGLDAVGVPSLIPEQETALVVLDEVGKMESFSEPFRNTVEELLVGDVPLLATVASHGVGFVKRVRQDPRITLVRMRREGRSGMPGEILRRLREAGIVKPESR